MLGIIGGTGLYSLDEMQCVARHDVTTMCGKPSAPITEGILNGTSCFFLPRHGSHHHLLPHEINFRANILALKQLGVRHIISVSAVGSLQEEYHAGDFALVSQYFDWVKDHRIKSFFGEGLVAHVSMARPTCESLSDHIYSIAKSMGVRIHKKATYACIDGPRFGTIAESHFLRGPAGCDIVGMTNVPESFLAREAQMCYSSLCIATDYDCWMDDPAQHATVEQIIQRYGGSLQQARDILQQVIKTWSPASDDCYCRTSLASAMITQPDAMTDKHRELLAVLSS
ncbi:MAG: 5'-methylthioadenosine phosphorylase [Spartobacteria bacterium]|nr:5'-methylthioadenosine phosphorylase [Spartobacteria bacterium]